VQPQFGFVLFLILTVLLLSLTVGTGLAGRRRLHFLSVLLTTGSLSGTIYFAELLGTLLDLESAGWAYPVHLWNAKAAVAAFLAALGTGAFYYFTEKGRRLHFFCAMLATALMVLALLTGLLMWMLAEPLPQ